jgi:hypothetical protein
MKGLGNFVAIAEASATCGVSSILMEMIAGRAGNCQISI